MRAASTLRRLHAFSLIELLVVMSIIGLVAVFAVPAATTIVMGTDLNRAAQTLSSQFALARQTAITRNHTVELRLISYADPDAPGESVNDPKTWKYRGMQMLEVLENGNKVVVGKLERLPGSVQMSESVYSSLLDGNAPAKAEKDQPTLTPVKADDAITTGADTQPLLPRLPAKSGRRYIFVAFDFLPDGSTNLPATGKWYVTILSAKDQLKLAALASSGGGGGASDPIQSLNYFTLQVDPVSGSTRSFRPSLGAR